MTRLADAQAADAAFPLVAAPNVSMPPSNDDWNASGRMYLPLARLGYLGVRKTREDLCASYIGDDVSDDAVENLIVDLVTFRAVLSDLSSLLDAAAEHHIGVLSDMKLRRGQSSKD